MGYDQTVDDRVTYNGPVNRDGKWEGRGALSFKHPSHPKPTVYLTTYKGGKDIGPREVVYSNGFCVEGGDPVPIFTPEQWHFQRNGNIITVNLEGRRSKPQTWVNGRLLSAVERDAKAARCAKRRREVAAMNRRVRVKREPVEEPVVTRVSQLQTSCRVVEPVPVVKQETAEAVLGLCLLGMLHK